MAYYIMNEIHGIINIVWCTMSKEDDTMTELTIPAAVENLEQVLAFVDGQLANCPPDVLLQIDIAVEEIYVNIAHYAYPSGRGEATIRCAVSRTSPPEATIELVDGGIPYDPLSRKDPDITLDAEERQIGGLGIFMVKDMMDQVTYRREGGKNILTMKKILLAGG